MNDFSAVRITGRCLEDGGVLWLTFSLCEAAFHLSGASFLRLHLTGDDPAGDPDRLNIAPRFGVDVNGIRVLDSRLEEPDRILSVPLPGPETDIRLVKLSECTQSILGLADIETDGRLTPLPELPRRLEFIGDSITCAYGVEAAGPEEHFSTATENAEKGCAALCAAALHAAPMLTAFSGHGIVSGYTGDPSVRNVDSLVPPYYETCGRLDFRLPSGRILQEIPWDFSRFQPQAIIINLGTNDLSWCQQDPDRKEFFRREYARFLPAVRHRNPSARILCVLGLLGGGLNEAMLGAVEDYRRETGDPLIRAVTVPEQDTARDGAGADFHPSEITQRRFGEFLTAELQSLLA